MSTVKELIAAQNTNAGLNKKTWGGIMINVQAYGAKGDGVADDTGAIQKALGELPQGGTLFFPTGSYRTTAPIVIPYPNITLAGVSKRNPQVPLTVFDGTVPSTIFVDHLSSGIVLSHANNVNGFKMTQITLACSTIIRAARGIAFDLGGNGSFRREFLFDNFTITGFTVGFEMIASSAESGTSEASMGVVRIINSSVMHNLHISKNTYGQWNGFVYENNDSGQNGYLPGQGGIDLKGHGVSICNNIMEGMRDAIKVTGNFRGLVVKNNYFEANVGDACINISGALGGFDIGPNTFLSVSSTHKVILRDVGGGKCYDPYWSVGVASMDMPILRDNNAEFKLNNSDGDTGFCRVDTPAAKMMELPKKATIYHITSGSLYDQASKSPFGDYNIPVIRYSTSGNGGVFKSIPITAAVGQWIVVAWTCKRKNASSLLGYVTAYINGVTGNGSKEFPIYVLERHYTDNEWFVVTAAVKTTVSATSLDVTVFPYGVSPAAGLVADMILPSVYVVDDINSVRPYCNERRNTHGVLNAAPAGGTWSVGDKVYMASPSAGGYEAQICIAAGTPGTWKGVGAIQA